MRRDWAIFEDYCRSRSLPSMPASLATVTDFLEATSCGEAQRARRAQAINAAHRAAGHPVPVRALLRRCAPQTVECAATLRSLTAQGWPQVMVARRDGALVAAMCAVGLSSRRVADLRHGDVSCRGGVVVIDGRIVPTSSDARACPACAIARWCEVVLACDAAGWRSVRSVMARHAADDRGDAPHRCAEPVLVNEGSWSPWWARSVAPRTGAVGDDGLSDRAVRMRVRSLLRLAESDGSAARAAVIESAAPTSGESQGERARSSLTLGDVGEVFTDVEQRLAALDDRVAELLRDASHVSDRARLLGL